MRRKVRWTWLLAALVAPVGAACSAILGLEPPPVADVADAGMTDAGGGAPAPACAPADASDGVTYFPLSAVAAKDGGTGGWDWFDTAPLKPASKSFAGGTFAEPYVYFAERGGGVVRYDTTGDFADTASWASFDLSSLTPPPAAVSFEGAVFDGRYVYFVPASTGASQSVLARFDTTGSFTAATSWALFVTTDIPGGDAGPPLSGFAGGGFDGRYLYLVPHSDGAADGVVARYDTTSTDFADAGRWSTFDVRATITPPPAVPASGFWGAVFDGTSLYFAPQWNGYAGGSGIAVRFQADAGFTTRSSWTAFDLTTVNGLAYDFEGAGFDGTHVYFAPRATGIVVRFDPTAGAFDSVQAWSTYDLSSVVQVDAAPTWGDYSGTAYDGRFVYFIPTGSDGTVVRYDTSSPFSADCAWSTADLASLVSIAQLDAGPSANEDFNGAVFDGQYLYLIPQNGVVFRFEAKTPASMPDLPYYHGSFF